MHQSNLSRTDKNTSLGRADDPQPGSSGVWSGISCVVTVVIWLAVEGYFLELDLSDLNVLDLRSLVSVQQYKKSRSGNLMELEDLDQRRRIISTIPMD